MFSRFKKSIRNIAPYVFNKINAKTLVNGFVLTITGMGLDILVPYLFGETFALLASGASSTVFLGLEMSPWVMIATGATAYTVRVAVIDTRNKTFAPLGPRAFQKSIMDYTNRAVNRSLEERSKPGDDLLRLQKGVSAVSTISTQICTQFIPVIGSTLTSATMLSWSYGPQFGGCLVAAVGACVVYNVNAAKTIVDLRSEALITGNKSFDDLMTAVNHPLTIQSFLKQEDEKERVRQSQFAFASAEANSNAYLYENARRQDIFLGLVFAAMNLLAGRGVLNNQLSAGDFATIQSLLVLFFGGFSEFGQAVSRVVSGARDAEVFFDYLEEKPKIIDRFPDIQLTVTPKNASVEFKNVNFHYDSKSDAKVLKDISCLALPGRKTGFVGSTGSGKSTCGKLINRFIEPIAGQVLIAGKDITTVSLQSLRSNIGIIEQNPVLLCGTLLENILYGFIALEGTPEKKIVDNVLNAARKDRIDIDAEEAIAKRQRESKEEIKPSPPGIRRIAQFAEGSAERLLINSALAAAEKARLTDFIKKETHGLLTTIEERGSNLSGGQVQRVAIARVLMRGEKLKFLLLDEPTSALDSENELLVQRSIDEIGRTYGLTQVWITHHLINLINADYIYVFDDGRIVEEGTHQHLITIENGTYAKLWANQNSDKKEQKNCLSESKAENFARQGQPRFGLFDKQLSQSSEPKDVVIDISDTVVIWHEGTYKI